MVAHPDGAGDGLDPLGFGFEILGPWEIEGEDLGIGYIAGGGRAFAGDLSEETRAGDVTEFSPVDERLRDFNGMLHGHGGVDGFDEALLTAAGACFARTSLAGFLVLASLFGGRFSGWTGGGAGFSGGAGLSGLARFLGGTGFLIRLFAARCFHVRPPNRLKAD